jgi:hypothetical protein
MTRARVVKELRESAAVVALAALAAFVVLSTLWGVRMMPWSGAEPRAFPFFEDGFLEHMATIGVAPRGWSSAGSENATSRTRRSGRSPSLSSACRACWRT